MSNFNNTILIPFIEELIDVSFNLELNDNSINNIKLLNKIISLYNSNKIIKSSKIYVNLNNYGVINFDDNKTEKDTKLFDKLIINSISKINSINNNSNFEIIKVNLNNERHLSWLYGFQRGYDEN